MKPTLLIMLAIVSIMLAGCNSNDAKDEYGTIGQVQDEYSVGNNTDKITDIVKDNEANVSEEIAENKVDDKTSEENKEPEKSDNDSKDFILVQDRYTISSPSQFKLYEMQGYLYFRNVSKGTQITLIPQRKSYDNGLEVADNITPYIKQMKYIYKEEERQVNLYGANIKTSKKVGSYDVKTEDCTLEFWTMVPNKEDFRTTAYMYHTTYNGQGLTLVGISEYESKEEITKQMDEILNSITPYKPTEKDKQITADQLTYHSLRGDGITFKYPTDWSLTEKDGISIIKAPITSTYYYSGMAIEYFADPNYEYVEDYAQFSADIEDKLMLGAFRTDSKINATQFMYNTGIQNVIMDTNIKGKEGILFEVETNIIPNNMLVQNELLETGTKYYSLRYTFLSKNVPCVLNILYPEFISKEDAYEFANVIIESILFK